MRQNLNISVVTPVFNREDEIVRMINSILNQNDYLPSEILIMDDCSTDRTVEKSSFFIDQCQSLGINLVIMKSSENKGPSYQRNKGWNAAQGEYIAFLDSDDTWHPDRLKLFVRDLSLNKDMLFWANNHTHKVSEKEISEIFFRNPVNIPFYKQLLKNQGNPSCAIIHRSVKERFLENMRHNEDHELFTRITYLYGLTFNPTKLTILHRKPHSKGGLSADVWKMRMGEFRLYINMISYTRLMIFFVPLLFLYSLLKHLRRLFLLRNVLYFNIIG